MRPVGPQEPVIPALALAQPGLDGGSPPGARMLQAVIQNKLNTHFSLPGKAVGSPSNSFPATQERARGSQRFSRPSSRRPRPDPIGAGRREAAPGRGGLKSGVRRPVHPTGDPARTPGRLGTEDSARRNPPKPALIHSPSLATAKACPHACPRVCFPGETGTGVGLAMINPDFSVSCWDSNFLARLLRINGRILSE